MSYVATVALSPSDQLTRVGEYDIQVFRTKIKWRIDLS